MGTLKLRMMNSLDVMLGQHSLSNNIRALTQRKLRQEQNMTRCLNPQAYFRINPDPESRSRCLPDRSQNVLDSII